MSMWELVELGELNNRDCVLDNSGVYTAINRVTENDVHKGVAGQRVKVRVDVMDAETDMPIISFQGPAEVVRKRLGDYLDYNGYDLSTEHLMYIGAEIERANYDAQFVQK